MLIPTIIMALVAVILFTVAVARGKGEQIKGLKIALELTYQILPIIVFAMITAGMATVLLPQELLSKWIGTESGARGIILGTAAGAITPGGPYVTLPVVAGLLNAGANAGTLVAFMTSWSLIAVSRLPLEFGIIGWKLTLIRLISCFFFPPIAGVFANIVAKGFKLS